jgi:hypothetical protein
LVRLPRLLLLDPTLLLRRRRRARVVLPGTSRYRLVRLVVVVSSMQRRLLRPVLTPSQR